MDAVLRAPHPELFFGCILLILATVLLFKQVIGPFKRHRAITNSIPCPRGLPLIGNLHQLGSLPHQNLAAMASKHAAPLMLLWLGSVPTLVVSTAEAARAAFRDNDRAMSGRPALRSFVRLSYGLQDISFSSPDNPARRAARRACVAELLGAPRVRAFRDVREAEAAALVAALTESGPAAVNLSEKLVATSNRIVRRVAFGDDGVMTADSRAAIAEAERLFGAFFVGDYIPWLGWLDKFREVQRRLDRNFRELDAFYERVINDHLDKQRAVVSKSKEEEDLVDVLLRLFSGRSQIKAILMDMLIAGTDTSAATVEWTMTELVRHPEVLAKAQHEVRSVVAGRGGGRDMVMEADLPGLKYLKQVIREAMRLHPPVPLLLPRETTDRCTVNGSEIPAKTRVIVNAMAIGLDPAAWGPDAAAFVPERHEEIADLSDHKPWHDSFALVPFGVGRRSCPGVHFATAVVELLLANLLFCFDWRAPLGEDVGVEEKNGLTVYRKNPLVLVAERRCSPSCS